MDSTGNKLTRALPWTVLSHLYKSFFRPASVGKDTAMQIHLVYCGSTCELFAGPGICSEKIIIDTLKQKDAIAFLNGLLVYFLAGGFITRYLLQSLPAADNWLTNFQRDFYSLEYFGIFDTFVPNGSGIRIKTKRPMKRFLIITVGLLTCFSLTTKSQDNVVADSVYTIVDVLPEFPGGRKALGKYVDGRKNHKYPVEASKKKIEGKVIVQFIINEDGTCTDFEVVKGIGYGCDEAAVEAFRKMPKWKPGLVNGKPVKVRTQMGYNYRL